MANTDFKTVDQYIGTFPGDVQAVLEKMREAIKKAAPEVVEVISYQLPAFKLEGKFLTYLGGWKKHVSLYPVPKGDKVLMRELKPYIKGKGTLQFQLDEPLPLPLINKILRSRVAEIRNGLEKNK